VKALDTLELSLLTVEPWLRGSDLMTAIGQSKTAVQHELGLIAHWFDTIGDAPVPEFSLRHLIDHEY